MVRFKCPVCNQLLSTREELCGRTTKCPKCTQELIVPTPPPPGSDDSGRSGIGRRAVFFCSMGIVLAGCVALVLYTVFRMQILSNEETALEKAKSLAAEQLAFNDDLLKRATTAQAESDRILASATSKEQAAEEAPRRAAFLAKQAEDDRKQAKEERATAQTLLEGNRKLLETIDQRQKQLQQTERETNQAKAEAANAKAEGEKLVKAAKQAEQEAEAKEAKASQAAKDAAKKLQQAEETQRKVAETLKRMEASPALKGLLLKMTSKVATDRKEAASLLKGLGPGVYPDSLSRAVCLAVTTAGEQNDLPMAKAMLDAFAVVDPELCPAVVSLMFDLRPTKDGGGIDFGPWIEALATINSLKRNAPASVLRFIASCAANASFSRDDTLTRYV